MARRPRPLILSFACCVFAVFALFAPPHPVQAHVGYSAHADNGYAIGTNHIVFDKDSDVSNGWGFNEKLNAIDSHFLGPNLVAAECESTSGPCINVQQVCFDNVEWWLRWDRDVFGSNPQHGRLRLNRCVSPPNNAASCRGIMMILGSHKWHSEHNNTCLDEPWVSLNEDSANAYDYSQLNIAYGVVRGGAS